MEGREIRIAEEPLRRWILEAYQKNKKSPGAAEKVLSAIRQYLSGPPGSESAHGRYWFEEDPEGATRQLLDELEHAVPGLARGACAPVLEKIRAVRASSEGEPLPGPEAGVPAIESPHDPALTPNVPALAGKIAVKTQLGKPLECAVISTLLLGLSRIGAELFEQALAGKS